MTGERQNPQVLATQYASKGDEKAAEQWQDKARKMLEQGKKK